MTCNFLPSPSLDECLSAFFLNPTTFPSEVVSDNYSTLYLLRRDIAQCLGYDPDTLLESGGGKILWPGLMAIFAGIDLLAKIYAIDDRRSEAGARFKCYLRSMMAPSVPPTLVDPIYGLRNAIMHSFGLYNSYREEGEEKEVRYILSESLPTLLETDETRCMPFIHFDINQLWRAFESSVANLEAHFRDMHALPDELEMYLNRYGFVPIR